MNEAQAQHIRVSSLAVVQATVKKRTTGTTCSSAKAHEAPIISHPETRGEKGSLREGSYNADESL